MSRKHTAECLINQRFGRLTVIESAPRTNSRSDRRWACRCDCGNSKVVAHHMLLSGNTSSCGCLRTEMTRQRSRTHGQTHIPEFRVWCAMKNRCSNPRVKGFADYGGRGIKVCDRWQRSFVDFIRYPRRIPLPSGMGRSRALEC